MLSHTVDYSTAHGANILANMIRAYWERRGKYPRLRIESEFNAASPTSQPHVSYVVRSDMIGGRPR